MGDVREEDHGLKLDKESARSALTTAHALPMAAATFARSSLRSLGYCLCNLINNAAPTSNLPMDYIRSQRLHLVAHVTLARDGRALQANVTFSRHVRVLSRRPGVILLDQNAHADIKTDARS